MLIGIACGPRPGKVTYDIKSPAEVWSKYVDHYAGIKSLAMKGNLTITTDKIYSCKLQLIYVSPDSFAFLTEGVLGVDLARGAIVGDSGFWEIPRENFHEKIRFGDRIYFESEKFWIDIENLLQAVFFFREVDMFQYAERQGSKFIYSCNHNSGKRILEMNRNSITPVRQIFYNNTDSAIAEYYNWKTISGNKFPLRLVMNSDNDSNSFSKIEYNVKKIRINPEIKLSFFSTKF